MAQLTLRVRTREGTERVQIAAGALVRDLREAIRASLGVRAEAQQLSLDKDLLAQRADAGAEPRPRLLSRARDDARALGDLGLGHGDFVYLRYEEGAAARDAGACAAAAAPPRLAGGKMTVKDLVARQIRMARQEAPHVPSVSFDRQAANAFQQYVRSTLGFVVPRCGILYGRDDEEGNVYVDFVYEPPQDVEEGSQRLLLMRDEAEEARVEFIADALGMRKVGWMVAQPPSVLEVPGGAGADGGEGKEGAAAGAAITMAYEFVKMAAKMQSEEGEKFFTVRRDDRGRRGPARGAARGPAHTARRAHGAGLTRPFQPPPPPATTALQLGVPVAEAREGA